MLGEEEAIVVEANPRDVHGVNYWDVTVTYRDGRFETARLGPEAVPEGLQPDERVMVSKAVNVVISIRRA